MNFLIHLLIIAVGIYVLASFAEHPGTTIFFVTMLVCGYLGSSEGFFGTLGGLLLGIIPGGFFALVIELIRAHLSKEPKRKKRRRPSKKKQDRKPTPVPDSNSSSAK